VCQIDLGSSQWAFWDRRIEEFAECPPEVLNVYDKKIPQDFFHAVKDTRTKDKEFYIEQHGAKADATVDVDTRIQFERGKARAFRIVSSCNNSSSAPQHKRLCKEKVIQFRLVERKDWHQNQFATPYLNPHNIQDVIFGANLGKGVPSVPCTLVVHQNFLVMPERDPKTGKHVIKERF